MRGHTPLQPCSEGAISFQNTPMETSDCRMRQHSRPFFFWKTLRNQNAPPGDGKREAANLRCEELVRADGIDSVSGHGGDPWTYPRMEKARKRTLKSSDSSRLSGSPLIQSAARIGAAQADLCLVRNRGPRRDDLKTVPKSKETRTMASAPGCGLTWKANAEDQNVLT